MNVEWEIAALRRRLAALEGSTGRRSEALVPTYLTIDPVTGEVSASFSGVVYADGITLAIPNKGGSSQPIQWVRTDDGNRQVGAIYLAGGEMIIHSQTKALDYPASIGLFANGVDFTDSASLTMQAGGGSGAIRAQVNLNNPLIIDAQGASNFLQSDPAVAATKNIMVPFTAGPAAAIAAGGTATVTWAIPTELQGFAGIRVVGMLTSLANPGGVGLRFTNTTTVLTVVIGATAAQAAGWFVLGLAFFTY